MKVVTDNNASSPELYVVEIDGYPRSVCRIFTEALRVGMELKQKFPHSHIQVHDVDET
jgi:hypothetical protein